VARVALKILKISQAEELARICAAVGLVQNLGALKALSTVGIVKGHMQLHAANLAIAAGAEIHEVAEVRDQLAKVLLVEKTINLSRAREILEAVRIAAQSPTVI
jgi:hydroxymethylglutaryl-CoA reductase